MKITMKTTGFKELEQAIASIEKKATAKAVMRRSMIKAALPVVVAAEALAPKGPTGNLKGSIGISTKLSKRQKREHKKAVAEGRAAIEMFLGPDYNKAGRHAHLVEFGTTPHKNGGQFKGTDHPGTKPQPFMRPAWDAEGQRTLDRLGAEMWAEIESAAKSAARSKRRAAKKNGWEV